MMGCGKLLLAAGALSATAIAITVWAGQAGATTFSVDGDGLGDFVTVQEGIDAASAGDTVLVFPGTYHEHIMLSCAADGVALVSQAGPELTIVTGDSVPPYPVVRCQSVGGSTLIEGFTFRAGLSYFPGGGIQCEYSASPRIVGNIIEDCQAMSSGNYGGGIAVQGGSPVIEGNLIRRNRAMDGGGLYLFGGDTTLRSNRVEGNRAEGFGGTQSGGGIFVVDGTHLLERNLIVGNHAQALGGAMILEAEATVTLHANTLAENTSELSTGGLFVRNASVDGRGNVIANNCGSAEGAAMVITALSSRSTCTFEDNIIFGNSSTAQNGAAVLISRGRSPSFRLNVLENPTVFEVRVSESPSPDTLDFRANWWGVTDSSSVEGRVWDCCDDPGIGACVDFADWCSDPSCNGQVTSVEQPEAVMETSWGRIKNLYR